MSSLIHVLLWNILADSRAVAPERGDLRVGRLKYQFLNLVYLTQ